MLSDFPAPSTPANSTTTGKPAEAKSCWSSTRLVRNAGSAASNSSCGHRASQLGGLEHQLPPVWCIQAYRAPGTMARMVDPAMSPLWPRSWNW
jgi:hypothetical protein